MVYLCLISYRSPIYSFGATNTEQALHKQRGPSQAEGDRAGGRWPQGGRTALLCGFGRVLRLKALPLDPDIIFPAA